MNKITITVTKQNIGKQIETLKKNKGLSYYKLSNIAGVTIAAIKEIESANKAYTIDTLLKIVHALDSEINIITPIITE